MIKNKTSAKSLSHFRIVRLFSKNGIFPDILGWSIGHKFQTSRKSWKNVQKGPEFWPGLEVHFGTFWAFLRNCRKRPKKCQNGQKWDLPNSPKMSKMGPAKFTKNVQKSSFFDQKPGFFGQKRGPF